MAEHNTQPDSPLDVALQIAEQGYPVFPCNPLNKRPMLDGGFHVATANTEQVKHWWKQWPQAMIGLPTGSVSGIVAIDIDVDPHKGIDGSDALVELVRKHGALPSTTEVLTPRGGRHLYFNLPPGAHVPCSTSKIGKNIDVRGDGGYVIAAGSVNATGKRYEYEASCPGRMADMPAWLVMATRTQRPIEPAEQPLETFRRLREGEGRNSRLTQLGGALRRLGMSPEGLLQALLGANETEFADPLSGAEVAAIAASLCKYQPVTGPEQARDAVDSVAESGPEIDLGTLDDVQLDHRLITPRQWVCGYRLQRGYVSATAGPGGVGKSAFEIASAVSISLGAPLMGEPVHDQGPTWIYCNEDDRDEMLRRYLAFCLLHGIDPEACRKTLRLSSGYGARQALIVATRCPQTRVVAPTPKVDLLIAELKAYDCVSLSVDPFVSTHRVEENSNGDLESVMALWREVAYEANCAIVIVSHIPKNNGGDSEAHAGNLGAIRGASSIGGAIRSGISVARMSAETAAKHGISDEERLHMVRIDSIKGNFSPPASEARWLRMRSVCLDNGTRPDYVGAFELAGELREVRGQRESEHEEVYSKLRVALMALPLRPGQGAPLSEYQERLCAAVGRSRAWLYEHVVRVIRESDSQEARMERAVVTWSKRETSVKGKPQLMIDRRLP